MNPMYLAAYTQQSQQSSSRGHFRLQTARRPLEIVYVLSASAPGPGRGPVQTNRPIAALSHRFAEYLWLVHEMCLSRSNETCANPKRMSHRGSIYTRALHYVRHRIAAQASQVLGADATRQLVLHLGLWAKSSEQAAEMVASRQDLSQAGHAAQHKWRTTAMQLGLFLDQLAAGMRGMALGAQCRLLILQVMDALWKELVAKWPPLSSFGSGSRSERASLRTDTLRAVLALEQSLRFLDRATTT